jgi:hypothetical protein
MTCNEKLLEDYRAYCGGNWGVAAYVFNFLIPAGLQRHHTLVDVGCGPLRIGKYLITFLDPGCYTGIEPERAMLEAGLKHELSAALRERQRPKFLVETIGTSSLAADWALAWDVFNHLSPRLLRLALCSVRADNWLLNVHLGEKSFTAPTDGEGWSYRYADTKVAVHTRESLEALIRECGYTSNVICVVDTDWKDHPFTILRLQRS